MISKSGTALADGERAVLVRALAGLAIIGASCLLAAESLVGRWVGPFVRANVLPMAQRNRLLLALGLGALAGVALGIWLYARAPRSFGLERVRRAAGLAAPLALLGLLPGLLSAEGWPDTMPLAIALTVFLLGLEPLWRLHFAAYQPPATTTGDPGIATVAALSARVRRALDAASARVPALLRGRGALVTVALLAIGYIAYMALFTVRNHHRFNTFTWDLGIFNNQIFNFLHGHPFRAPVLIRAGNWSELRNHVEAVMMFLLPIYALHPAAETLLVLQALLLGLAGIFLYRFAARRLPAPTALALTLAYYLYPPLHGAQFFDVHFQPIAAAFLLVAIDCFDTGRMRLFVLFFVLALSCREDISVGTAAFGLFLILTGHRMKVGAVIFVTSLAYFVAMRFLIMPAFGAWGFAEFYRQLFPPDAKGGFGGIIKTILSNPLYTFKTLLTSDKLRYALQLLAPLAFLPVRRLHLAMSLLPGAYFTLLTTEYAPPLDIAFQYGCYFVPYIFPAAALALAELGSGPDGTVRRRAALATMLVGTLVATTHWGAFPPRQAFRTVYGKQVVFDPLTPELIQRRKDLRALIAMVPPQAILAATDNELPHVSNRIDCWNLSTGFQGADYLLYTKINPAAAETQQVRAAEAAGYQVIADRPAYLLYKRPGAP